MTQSFTSLNKFLLHGETSGIATPPDVDASPLQVALSILSGFPDSLMVPI